MFNSISQFLDTWQRESETTAQVFAQLTDGSLAQPVAPGYRTLSQLAWHIAGSIGKIAAPTGLTVDAPDDKTTPVPASAAQLLMAYRAAASSLAGGVQSRWTDATLTQTDRMYGQEWARGYTLWVILAHEIHHRGQMTVLMRQAGLPVPDVYGPAGQGGRAAGR